MSVQTENKCNSASVATLKSGTQRETLTCEPGAAAACRSRTPTLAFRWQQIAEMIQPGERAEEVKVVSSLTPNLSGLSERGRLPRACHDDSARGTSH